MSGDPKMPCDDCVHLGTGHADPARSIIGKCFWYGPLPAWIAATEFQPLIRRGQPGLAWCPTQKPKARTR